jgi:hypothetical protein
VTGAAAVDRRLEAVLRPQADQGGGARVELGDRGGREQLVGVALVNRLAGGGVYQENAPAGFFVRRLLEGLLDPGRQRLGAGRSGGQQREQQTGDEAARGHRKVSGKAEGNLPGGVVAYSIYSAACG